MDLIEDPVSLETPIGDGDSLYADVIEDEGSDRPEDRHVPSICARRRSRRPSTHLNERMPGACSSCGTDSPASRRGRSRRLASVLGVTSERVRQLEANAFRELQAAAPELKHYLRA